MCQKIFQNYDMNFEVKIFRNRKICNLRIYLLVTTTANLIIIRNLQNLFVTTSYIV